jgi:hypothetical protein
LGAGGRRFKSGRPDHAFDPNASDPASTVELPLCWSGEDLFDGSEEFFGPERLGQVAVGAHDPARGSCSRGLRSVMAWRLQRRRGVWS